MALSELKLVLSVDGAGKVTGNLKDVEGAVDSLGKKTTSATNMMAEAWKVFSAAAIGLALGAVVKESIQAALQMERLNKLFAAAAGDANLAGRELEYIRGVSNRLGLDLVSTADSYGKFLANIRGTTLEGEKGRKVFEAVSGATSALGLTTETTNRAFTALNQMLAKGTVSSEELRQQWSEAIPGGFKMAADAMGMTTGELGKALEQGKIMAEDLLPKLAVQLEKTYGKAALEGANSAQAAINRMNNAMLESKATLGSALMPAFTDLMTTVITPLVKMIGDLVRALQHGAATVAFFVNQTADGFKALLSGKVFTDKGYKESMNDAIENEKIYKSAIDKIWTQPGAGAYTTAEKLRQAGNKSPKPLTDGKAEKEAAKALKLAEQYEKDYLADMEKWRKAQEQLADTYDKAALATAEQHKDQQLAILKNQYDANLLSHAEYLDKQYRQQVAASDKALEQLESAAIRNDQAYYAALKAEPVKPVDGNPVAVEAYNKAITLTINLLKESETAWMKVDAAAAKAAKDGIQHQGKLANETITTNKIQLDTEAAILTMAGDTYAATLKQIEADKLSRKPIDEKTDALRNQLDELKKLKSAQEEYNALQSITNATTDINISMVTDPYDKERAAMEERYRREAQLIHQNMVLKSQAGTLTTAEYEAQSDKLIAMAAKRDQDVAQSQLAQGRAGWDGVVSAASRAFPKLTGIDKALNAVYKDHSVNRLATEADVTDGLVNVKTGLKAKAGDLVKDETKSSLSMYGSYTGAAGAMFEGLAATQDTSSRAGFETAKALNIGSAVMSTASGIMNAFATLPTLAAIPMSAMIAAMGVMQIATIAGTTFGGGAPAIQTPSGSFAGGSAGTGGAVGGSIGKQVTSVQDSQSQATLSAIASSMENASLAIGRVADGLTQVSGLFEDGSFLTNAITALAYSSNLPNYTAPKTRYFAQTATLSMDQGTVNAQIKEYWETLQTNGWRHVKDVVTSNGSLQDLIDAQMQQVTSSVFRAAVATGTLADVAQANMPTTEIKMGGRKPEDVAADLERWFTDASNALAKTVDGLIDFAFYGENAFDALMRLSTALQSSNEGFELIGATLITGSLAGANTAYKLQDMMGGEDAFTESIDTYFKAMFSDTEQDAARATQAARQRTVAFKEMNATFTDDAAIVMPTTREEFKALVASVTADLNNLTTTYTANDGTMVVAADRASSLFGSLMGVAESFGEVMDAADVAAEHLKAVKTATEDLDVRYLAATGKTTESEALSRQLSGQREIEQAIVDNMGQPYIDRLKEVLAAEATVTESMKDYTDQRKGLQDQLNILTGATTQRDLDRLNLLDAESIRLQDEIWLLQDKKIVDDQKATLQTQYNNLTMSSTELLNLQRNALDASNRELFDNIQLATEAKAVATKKAELDQQILNLTNKYTDRQIALNAITDTGNKALQQRIYDLQDEATLLERRNGLKEQYDVTAGIRTQQDIDLSKIIDPWSKAMQARIWALADETAATELNTATLQTAVDTANTALETAKSNLQSAFDAEKERLTTAYDLELTRLTTNLDAVSETVSKLTGYVDKLKSARESMTLADVTYQRNQYAAAQASMAALLVQARGGDLSGLETMDDSLSILTGQGADAYANSTDYQRDFWRTSNSISELESLAGVQLTDAQRANDLAQQQIDTLTTNHNDQLAAMDAQLNALLGLNVAAMSIADAISFLSGAQATSASASAALSAATPATPTAATKTTYTDAQVMQYIQDAVAKYGYTDTAGYDVYAAAAKYGVDSAQITRAGATAYGWTQADVNKWVDDHNLPRFADGGITSGISIAGEAGPEAVIPLPDGRRVPVQMTGQSDLSSAELREIKALLRDLLQTNKSVGAETSKSGKKLVDILEDWDANGLPAGDGTTTLTLLAA